MTDTIQTEWVSKRLLGIMVIAGLSISATSFMIINDELNTTLSNGQVTTLCDNGLCYNSVSETIPIGSFVQQNADINSETVIQNNESFTSLTFNKNTKADYELTDNSATLFPTKDSFLREGIKDVNEGGNNILRVMGTGETNNRALIAFDQNDLEEIMTDKSLASAKLRLFIVSNDGQWDENQALNLHMVDSPWDEGTAVNAPYGSFVGTQNGATWNCSSTSDCEDWNGGQFIEEATDSITITNEVNGKWIEFDVTSDVQSFLVDAENNGWIIMKADEDSSGRVNFVARECASCDMIPQLEITFA